MSARFLPAAWFIAHKEVRYALRQRETLLWVFVMPILFFYFLGTVTGGHRGRGLMPDKTALTLVAPADAGFLADQVARRLEEQGFALTRVDGVAALPPVERRLVLPARLTQRVLAGERVQAEFVRQGDDPSAEIEKLRVARSVYTVLADLVVSQEAQQPPSPEAFDRLARRPRNLQVVVTSAGKRKQPPGGFAQTIPGTLVMFTMLVLLTSGAIPLVIEREQGLLRRLASTPLPRGAIVLGKWAGKLALALVQIGFGVGAGTLLFRMDWGAALPMVLAVLVAWAALNASLGLLLGSLARTQAQAAGIGVIATMALAALGGCMWPIEIAPAWMQKLALGLPTGWAMDALHRLISFGAGPLEAVPHVLALGAAALVTGRLAVRCFRFY